MTHKIVKKHYTYKCGDGCCDEEGHEWYVNGELVHASPCEDNAWLAVLKKLGFDAEITGVNKEGEEEWTLQ